MAKQLQQHVRFWQSTFWVIASLAGLIVFAILTGYFLTPSWVIVVTSLLVSVMAWGIAIICYIQRYKIQQEKTELEILLQQKIERFNAEKAELEGRLATQKEECRKILSQNTVLQKRNNRKNEFFRQMSHELRTPMNGIIGSIQLVLDELYDNPEEERELLQQARQSSLHLLTLINQVLDLEKIEAGRVSVDLKMIDLQSCLSAATYLQIANIRQKGLHLHRQNYQDIITVKADPIKLKQVFINVIGNAIKFTDQGGITILTDIKCVSLSKRRGNAHKTKMAVITVQDTGIGIDPSTQNKLFQPFQVENESRVYPQGSTGLGLVISKHLVEMMGGQINLNSIGRNQGTTVEILLPLASVD